MMESLTIDQIQEGNTFSFKHQITAEDLDQFIALSGDESSLHVDESFAQERGFKGRVVHGAYLTCFFSKLVGMHLPGENALLQSMNTRFLSPAYVGDQLEISAVADQVSVGTKTLVLKANIIHSSTEELLVKSTIMVGFTN